MSAQRTCISESFPAIISKELMYFFSFMFLFYALLFLSSWPTTETRHSKIDYIGNYPERDGQLGKSNSVCECTFM